MIDLHLHLDGSINSEDMFCLAKMSGIVLPAQREEEIRKMLTVEPGCTNLGEYLEKFALPLQVLQTQESMEFAVYRLLEKLQGQGLCYAEIRFAPQLHRERGLTQEAVVHAAVSGLEQGTRKFGISAGLILCCMRGGENREENMETVAVAEKFLGKGVCAVDLAGNEAAFSTEGFSDVFDRARERGLPAVIHAGEAAGPKSVRKALELRALRIGHGIHAMEDAELLEQLRDRKIYLEMCYSSNLQTKTVGSPEEYPLPEFMAKGLLVTVNTDNMTVSDTDLKKEYLLLQKQFALNGDTLRQLALNAADGAFITEERSALKLRIQREFAAWLGGE